MLFLSFILLLIELLDELVFGAQGAVLPVLRGELDLSYGQLGLLLSIPSVVSSVIEPLLFILADTWRRKLIIVGGGLAFALALGLIALGQSFAALLVAFVLLYPASGAFVSLSQAALMDLHPTRHEQMMARWTLFGSVGVVAGSLLLAGVLQLGANWRWLYIAFAALALALATLLWTRRMPTPAASGAAFSFRDGLRASVRALRDPRILRWLVLLDLANLLGDILLDFTALYFVDVAQLSESEAALAVTLLSGAGLVGHALIIPLLERVRGLSYLRWSAALVLLLYAALLIVPSPSVKFALLAGVGVGASGWYAVLRGQLYSAMPGQSGISLVVSSLAGAVGGLIPGALGGIAGVVGLAWTMPLLALGPLSLLLGLPKEERKTEG